MQRECVRVRPICTCTQIYNPQDQYQCVECPAYQIANAGNTQCVDATCAQDNYYLGPPADCYACRECPSGLYPDPQRRTCHRLITTTCTCRQKFAADGYNCIDCPVGTHPSHDNRDCVSMNCLPDQIFRTDLACATCEYCPPGSIPDEQTKERCIVSPRPAVIVGLPQCGINSYYSWDRTECIPCPVGTTASADKTRCIGACNGSLDIITSDGNCFTCTYGNVPDASRTRCVKRNFFLQQE